MATLSNQAVRVHVYQHMRSGSLQAAARSPGPEWRHYGSGSPQAAARIVRDRLEYETQCDIDAEDMLRLGYDKGYTGL
jgi:hypothetical protein